MNDLEQKLELAISRSERIKKARDEAERLLEQKSRELYEANRELEKAHKGLEEDIKQATAELNDSNQQLRKALNERSTFIGQMSHEVRTPLNAIMGLSEILLSTKLDDVQSDYLNTINSAAGSLVVLLSDMLDITKMEAGKLEIHLEPVSARKIHKNVVSMFEMEAKAKGLELKLFIDEQVPEFIIIDKGRYKQILTNLVSNAIKNTELGFVNVSVSYDTATYSEGIGGLNVRIVDTGIGIPSDQVKRIFNAYEQLGVSSGGVGLGLAICKELCDLMHGEIRCQSEFGEGSTFQLKIPAESAQKQTDSIKGAEQKDLGTNTKLNILVAEDNLTNQKVLTAQLAQLGQKATIVDNGLEALKQLETKCFDVVFLDILMPVMDGEETIKAIRQSGSDVSNHYCVALTASSYQDQKQRLLAKGFDAFLSKPLSMAELDAALNQVVQKRQSVSVAESAKESAKESTKAAGKESVTKNSENPSASTSALTGAKNSEPQFDLSYLRSQFGDLCETIFADIAPTFLEHSSQELNQLKAAIEGAKLDSIIKYSHSIKGGSSSMGLFDLAEKLEAIERNHDSVSIYEWFDQAETMWLGYQRQILNTLQILNTQDSLATDS